jgi:Tfp pilus assembly protein PilX
MKLHSLPQPARRQRGSILAMTLIVTGIIGFTLASYLSLISAQNRSTYRSLTWNSTMPLIEAGIEEALAHLNSEGVTNLVSQGWQGQGNLAVLSRDLGDGRFTVTHH